MASLLLLTPAVTPPAQVLPALNSLAHTVRYGPLEVSRVVTTTNAELACDVVIVDAREEVAMARAVCRAIGTTGLGLPVLLLIAETALPLVTREWGCADLVLPTVSAKELAARIRLLTPSDLPPESGPLDPLITVGDLTIDVTSYAVRLRGLPIDLTYREFELLRFLAQAPGHVYTRAQLLQEVWGYDYYGGTRTVDVHIRRLRAKLGPDLESIITTIRNVGYRFDYRASKG